MNEIKILLEKRVGEIDLVKAFHSADHSWQTVDTQQLPALLFHFCNQFFFFFNSQLCFMIKHLISGLQPFPKKINLGTLR